MHSTITRATGIVLLSLTTLAASARTNSPFLNNRLSFTENKGQVKDQFKNPRNDIQFSLQGQGVNVFVGDGQLHYQWSKTLATREITIGGRMSREATEAQMYRMDVELSLIHIPSPRDCS